MDDTAQLLEEALQLHKAGALDAAVQVYEAVLGVSPGDVDALHLLGVARMQQNSVWEALGLITAALEGAPRLAGALVNRGLLFLQLGNAPVALLDIDRALLLEPHNEDGLMRRAEALRALGRFDEAETCLRYLLGIRPSLTAATDLLEILRDTEPNETQRGYSLATIFAKRGALLVLSGAFTAAEADFRRALIVEPDNAEARFNQSLLNLLNGIFDLGWREYEFRWAALKFPRPGELVPLPEWKGEDLSGRRLLLLGEQGFGDNIQFVRFVVYLAQRGIDVTLLAPPELGRLFASICDGRIIVALADPAAYDVVASLLSIPYILGLSFASIPKEVPYLAADEEARQLCAALLGQKGRPRLGIVWAGNPAHPHDARRSIRLNDILVVIPDGLEVICLQKGINDEDAITLAADGRVRRVDALLSDFAMTAAVVEAMDLVVTVDTSVAHLAGALARPVWILLSHVPDWRWLRDRSDSPWYPTARLFRQERADRWEEPLEALRLQLSSFAGSRA